MPCPQPQAFRPACRQWQSYRPAEALRRIAPLYAVKSAAECAVERLRLRQERAKTLLAELHGWLRATHRTVATGSGTAMAIDYSLKRWAALERHVESCTRPIDNSPVENTIPRV